MSAKTKRKNFWAGVVLLVLGGICAAIWSRSVESSDDAARLVHGGKIGPEVEARADRATALVSHPEAGGDEMAESEPSARGGTAKGSSATGAAAPVDEAHIREMLRRDFDGLVETRRPDGGYSLSLEGRFRHLSVRVPGAEDSAEIVRCFCDADALLTALHSGHSSAPAASGEAAASRHSLSR